MNDEPSALVIGKLLKRLGELERRVAVLEGEPEPDPKPVASPPPLPEPEPEPEPTPVIARPLPPEPEPEPEPWVAPKPALLDDALGYEPKPTPARPVQSGGLEQAIGLKLAGWVGALVVVVGAAMGVKFAHDAGWFGKTPPELRMVLMALGGFGLIGAGEWVYRRVNTLSAVGLFAAGIALLFVVSYTGYGFLDVYGQTTAFVLMAVTALIGAGVAARGKLVSIAIVALIGGHLTPIILGGDLPTLTPLLSHLLMLQVIGLTLAWYGSAVKWWAVRWFVLVTTALWVLGLAVVGDEAPRVMTFTLIFAALFLVEQVLSAWRGGPAWAKPSGLHLENAVVFSPLVVIGLAAVTVTTLGTGVTAAAWLLGYAAVLLGGSVALRRGVWGTALSKVFAALGVGLVIVSVPIALSGPAVVMTWAALAVVLGMLSVRLPSVIALVGSIMTWLAGVVYVLSMAARERPGTMPVEIALSALGVDWPTWVLLAALLMAVGWALGWLLTMFPAEGDDEGDDAVALTAGGNGMLGVATFIGALAVVVGLPSVAGTTALLLFAWLLAGLDIARPRLAAVVAALLLVALAAVKWAGVDLLAQRFGDGWTADQLGQLPLLNPTLLLGTAIAVTGVGITWLRRVRLGVIGVG
ncbi:MAG: DUF2339 domain-containing protein, partial [Planctomycetota bacterium]